MINFWIPSELQSIECEWWTRADEPAKYFLSTLQKSLYHNYNNNEL